jgi:hypothetical protein
MLRTPRLLFPFPLLVLAACATGSGILPSGPDTYSVQERRAPVLGGAMKAKEVALTEAAQFCQQKGQAFFPVSEAESAFPPGNPWGNTRFDLMFRCGGTASNSVDDLPLNATQYRITASGSTQAETQDLVLLRASEIAINHGYNGFVINSTTDQSVSGTVMTPSSFATSGSATVAGGNGVASGVAGATTTYTPASATMLFKPGQAVFITLVQQGGFDAHLIRANLVPKYEPPAPPQAAAPAMASTTTAPPPPTEPTAPTSGPAPR